MFIYENNYINCNYKMELNEQLKQALVELRKNKERKDNRSDSH